MAVQATGFFSDKVSGFIYRAGRWEPRPLPLPGCTVSPALFPLSLAIFIYLGFASLVKPKQDLPVVLQKAEEAVHLPCSSFPCVDSSLAGEFPLDAEQRQLGDGMMPAK